MLILIRGLPRSGKTSFAQMLLTTFSMAGANAVHFEADQYFTKQDGTYEFNPKELGKAHAVCQKSVRDALGLPFDFVIVANTFTRNWEMKPYIDMAKEANWPVWVITCEGQHQENGHNVPPEKIQAMAERWEPYRAG